MKVLGQIVLFIILSNSLFGQKVDLGLVSGWAEDHLLNYYSLINNCIDPDFGSEDKYFFKGEINQNYISDDYKFENFASSLDDLLGMYSKSDVSNLEYIVSNVIGPFYNQGDKFATLIVEGTESSLTGNDKEINYHVLIEINELGELKRNLKISNQPKFLSSSSFEGNLESQSDSDNIYYSAINAYFQGNLIDYKIDIQKAIKLGSVKAKLFDLKLKYKEWNFGSYDVGQSQESYNEIKLMAEELLSDSLPEVYGIYAQYLLDDFRASDYDCKYLDKWIELVSFGVKHNEPLCLRQVAINYCLEGKFPFWGHIATCYPDPEGYAVNREKVREIRTKLIEDWDDQYGTGKFITWEKYCDMMQEAMKNSPYEFVEFEFYKFVFHDGPVESKDFVPFIEKKYGKDGVEKLHEQFLATSDLNLGRVAKRYYECMCPKIYTSKHNFYKLKVDESKCKKFDNIR